MQTDIENRALRFLLKALGAAVLVKAQQLDAAKAAERSVMGFFSGLDSIIKLHLPPSTAMSG
jgi:hypothetical protein